jgi:hypothetical protein
MKALAPLARAAALVAALTIASTFCCDNCARVIVIRGPVLLAWVRVPGESRSPASESLPSM